MTEPHTAQPAAAETADAVNEVHPEAVETIEKALQAEVDALKDKLLRTLAEMENLRRRTEKEIELTERDLLKTLERHGIRKVEPLNERFDPNLHQAMFEAEDPTVPAGTVTQVVQPGFVIGERVLRPALVGVAKGGPKSA
ncbi:MAG: nucleotide exchange factor GrpE [Rhizobiales bacterium]|nr:nucleotide exchange factor GrpE [Hyphomicrobiales bacterium]